MRWRNRKRNPLETEKEGKLIAKFAIPAIISMLVSSLYNIVDQIFIGQESDFWEMRRPISHFRCRSSVRQQRFFWESAVHRILTCVPGAEIMRRQAGSQEPDLLCW